RENQHRHAEQDWQSVEQAAKDIGPHRPFTSGEMAAGGPPARAFLRPVAVRPSLPPLQGDQGTENERNADHDPSRDHSKSTLVKSWNQLCALVKPLTFLVIARGLRSWTMNTHGASSTTIACARRVSLRICAWSLDFSIRSISMSNSWFFQLAQLRPFGAA